MIGRTKKEINVAIERFLMRNPFPCLEGRGSLSKKSPGEFERAEALSFSIIFGDMRGENAGFLKEHVPALAVKNPFLAPPSPGNPAGFQKTGPLPSKNDRFLTARGAFDAPNAPVV